MKNASLAPASKRHSRQYPITSPEQSSILLSSIQSLSPGCRSSLISIALSTLALGNSFFPAPRPIFSIVNFSGFFPSDSAAMAAPVGVTISPCCSVCLRVSPWPDAISSTAGTGTGNIPCWQCTCPCPSQISEATTLSTLSSSMHAAADTISTIESTAPTS